MTFARLGKMAAPGAWHGPSTLGYTPRMRVFLSSTHADLQAHRIAVLDAIAIEQWHCDHDEHWGSRDSDPAAFCVRGSPRPMSSSLSQA